LKEHQQGGLASGDFQLRP